MRSRLLSELNTHPVEEASFTGLVFKRYESHVLQQLQLLHAWQTEGALFNPAEMV